MPNRLAGESSPYLLQHAHNPVDWYPWGDEAIAKAKNEDKFIFLSIGYSSCHWCHVMERESFEDESIAALLNEHFVSIKVDREERPDIDAVYMEAVQMMTGHGGWPLNVFLTPEQAPFFGGTYFPPQPVQHRPSFREVLERLITLKNEQQDQILQRAQQLSTVLQRDMYAQFPAVEVQPEALHQMIEKIEAEFDDLNGGFSSAPKFPHAMTLSLLFQLSNAVKQPKATEMALHSLQCMIEGGLFDQVGGGFHRYSTDERWLVPHFEKMLYDNALLITCLAEAMQHSSHPIFKRALYQTFTFLLREMRSDEGLFYSALDADSEHEEGKYYVFSYEELKQALDEPSFNHVQALFDISPSGNWEHNIILERRKIPGENEPTAVQEETILSTLLKYRETHKPYPAVDTKAITAWNALLIKAFCHAWQATADPQFLTTARQCADALLQHQWIDGLLYRIRNERTSKQIGFLDDYALLAEALIHLFEGTGEYRYLQMAETLSDAIREAFFDTEQDAFYFSSRFHTDFSIKNRELFDNATPSATSAAIRVFQRLGHLLDDTNLRHLAKRCLKRLSTMCTQYPLSFSYAAQALVHDLIPMKELVIQDDTSGSFLKALSTQYFGQALFCYNPDVAAQQQLALLKGKRLHKPVFYLCQAFECKKPVFEASEIGKVLNTK